mmetsp:Transcript_37653/g.117044  ORF Transcript_37653/g.117044 Transcript_37653/m.117044 type:complete len:241 (-) Transcript_37653:65-787(-)
MQLPAVREEELLAGVGEGVLPMHGAQHLVVCGVVLQAHAVHQGVLERQLGRGAPAAALPAALLRVRHAGDELVHGEVLRDGLDLRMRPHHRLGGVGPAAAALALVLDRRHGPGEAPVNVLRQREGPLWLPEHGGLVHEARVAVSLAAALVALLGQAVGQVGHAEDGSPVALVALRDALERPTENAEALLLLLAALVRLPKPPLEVLELLARVHVGRAGGRRRGQSENRRGGQGACQPHGL